MKNATKEEFEQWYLVEKLSTRQIAEKLETSQPTARKLMKQLGIQMRTYKENKTPFKKGDKFSEEHKQKIAQALKGNDNWKSKDTGKHFNFQQEKVNCAYCNKEFYKKASLLHEGNYFCNNVCNGNWKAINLVGENHPNYSRQEIPCAWCGKEVLRREKQITEGNNFFCDPKCNGFWKQENTTGENAYNWKGGYKSYYGENWTRQRRVVLERDKYTCQNCGLTKEDLGKNPDVHHIKPFRLFGLENYIQANNVDNLISYCNKCHTTIEAQTTE